MNILAGNAATMGGGAVPAQHTPEYPRNRSTGGSVQAPTSHERLERPLAESRPVLDLSDTALTRRDLPRGSLVDIVV